MENIHITDRKQHYRLKISTSQIENNIIYRTSTQIENNNMDRKYSTTQIDLEF